MLEGAGVFARDINVIGGEPFLHSDIAKFVFQLRSQIKVKRLLSLTTNGFWVSASAISQYSDLFDCLDVLNISVYPKIVEKLGGMSRLYDFADLIRCRYPLLRVNLYHAFRFHPWKYCSKPVFGPESCWWKDCTMLNIDGTVARCGVARNAMVHPRVSSEFVLNRHEMFFDLNSNIGDFEHWYLKFPYASCFYCSNRNFNSDIGWERMPSK